MKKPSELSMDQALMRLAYDMLYNRSDLSLQIWWSVSNNRPIFHSELKDYLWEELMMEWFIRRFLNDADFKKKCEFGILDMEDADEQWLKKEMADAYVPPSGTPLDKEVQSMVDNIRDRGGEIYEKFGNNSG